MKNVCVQCEDTVWAKICCRDLMVDLKAAKRVGLTIPPNVLARAGRVIR